MKKLTVALVMSFTALTATATERFHPNNLFIKMKEGQALVESPLILSSKNIVGEIYLVKTRDATALAESLIDDPAIEYSQKDFYGDKKPMPLLQTFSPSQMMLKNISSFNFLFNDPDASKLWAFNDKAGMDVNGAYANLPNITPEEIIVAVVDTGVDHNHEDLRDVMWVNSGEIPGDGIDNDKNGYIDDIHGINTLVRDAQGRATMNTMASFWHGTHVAGTIAATQNNGIGIAGVASNVKIMAIRTVPDGLDELDSDIVEAFQYAGMMGARIINCSFGKNKNEGGMVVRDVINAIGKKYNVLVVASSGNNSFGPVNWHNIDVDLKFPASFDSANMLTIASTTSSNAVSGFSNIGKLTVDVAAPGSDIYSTVNGNKYGLASGTSMAAPNTSGAAAMVLGYYPTLSAVTLKSILMTSSSKKIPALAAKTVSGGVVNLKSALERAALIQRKR